jgi:inosine/xanthosine triphosphatase
MKTIAVASTNPVKVKAARAGFEKIFPAEEFDIQMVKAPSGVSNQPSSDEETFLGALNRARHTAELSPAADFWVGIEGGVQDCPFETCQDEMMAFAWVVILGSFNVKPPQGAPGLRCGKGRTGAFFLPQAVVKLVRQGMELGEADDAVFGRSDSKQENGAVGLLTGDVIDRAILYEGAVVLALIPFRNQDLFG